VAANEEGFVVRARSTGSCAALIVALGWVVWAQPAATQEAQTPAAAAAAAAAARRESAATPEAPGSKAPTEAAGLQTGPADITPHWSKYDYPRSIPEGIPFYVVVRGDTLWDISARFLGSPYLWPQVWQENRYIKDAHWIYPGDPLALPKLQVVGQAGQGQPGEEGALVGEEQLFPEGSTGAQGAGGPSLVPVIPELEARCVPYVARHREDSSLVVVGSEAGNTKVSLATEDIIYLNKGTSAGIKVGDRFTILHDAGAVESPRTHRRFGHRIEPVGTARVILASEDSASALIEEACLDTVVGDYLKPFEKPTVPLMTLHGDVDPHEPSSGKAQGEVISFMYGADTPSSGDLAMVDLGTRDGVSPGTSMLAYRMVQPGIDVSRWVIAELIAVRTDEDSSTVRIVSARAALTPGDHVEVR
jgi:hypothetical protein